MKKGAKTFLLLNLKIQYFIFQKKLFLKIKKQTMLGHVTRVCSLAYGFRELAQGCFLEEIKKGG